MVANWRVSTPVAHTADEFGLLLKNLFALRGLDLASVDGIAISSVVPPLDSALRQMCDLYLKVKPLFIEPGVKTGVPVLTDNPSEVGADRIVNCVAGYERFHGPVIIVDMGTATKFDVVSKNGEFLGGAIAPGLGISAEALFARAAKLPRVEVKKPLKVIGTGTVDNMQIGLYYGYIGLVDGILERMLAEMGPETKTIATGGVGGADRGWFEVHRGCRRDADADGVCESSMSVTWTETEDAGSLLSLAGARSHRPLFPGHAELLQLLHRDRGAISAEAWIASDAFDAGLGAD